MVAQGIEDKFPHGRGKRQQELPVETPVRNLSSVNDATESQGSNGGVTAIDSGKRVVEIVRILQFTG